MKIAIIGYSGAGKSTLAKKLADKYNYPLLYLDKINFKEDWQERDTKEAKALVKDFMQNDSWVIDGNYRALYQKERLKEADQIIFLNFPRRICFFRALKRYFNYKDSVRESAANGCIEKFDFEFAKWILVGGRCKKYRQNYNNICSLYKDKVIVCKNQRDVQKLHKLHSIFS